MTEVITIANRKGGVGKTTTTLNLAYSLKEISKKVLVIDLDPQANLTRCFDVGNTENIKNIGHLLMEELEEESYSVEEYILSYDEIDLIPSSIYLSAVETQMRVETGSERILLEIIKQEKERYDYILIDTSPSLNILTINALCGSDSVLIVADTQMFEVIGINELLKTVQKIKNRVNPKLKVQGIIEKERKSEDKTDSRKTLRKEYNLSGASIARYLRLNELSRSWKKEVDEDKIGLTMAVDLSYLSDDIQKYLYQKCREIDLILKPNDAKTLHLMNRQEDLNQEMITTYLLNLKKPKMKEYQNIKLSQSVYKKFFHDERKEDVEEIIEKALEFYFKEYLR